MQSPDKWREFIMGLKDGGEVELELNFSPGSATTAMMLSQFDSDTVGNKQVVFATGQIWSFAAGCTNLSPAVPNEDKMTASATFKVSGKPTLA
jgi:hypothetical protein